MNLKNNKIELMYYILITIVFIIAIGLRIVTFINHHYYLPIDECHSLDVTRFTFKELFTTYKTGANFLPLYGAILKIIKEISNFNYIFLKLPSLLASMASIFLFYKLTNKVLKNKTLVISALTIFGLSYNLIYLGQMVKPYIFDVLCTLLILYSTLNIREKLNTNSFTIKNFFFTTITSIVVIYLSIPSIIILHICLGILLIENIIKKNITNIKYLLTFELIIGSILCFEYFTYIRQMHTITSVKDQWLDNSFYFFPTSLDAVNALFNFSFFSFFYWDNICPYRFPNYMLIIYLGIFFIGIINFLKKENFTKGIFIVAPIFFFLAISYFKFYPFCNRLITFLIPIFILITFKAFDFSQNRKLQIFQGTISIFLVMAFITWMINGRYIEFLLNFDKEHYQLEKTYIEKLKHLNNDEVILYTGHPFFLSLRNTNIILIDRFKYNDTKKLNNEIYNAFNYNKIYFNYSEVNDSQEMIDKVISIIEENNYKMILNFKYKHNNELPYYVFEKIKQKD